MQLTRTPRLVSAAPCSKVRPAMVVMIVQLIIIISLAARFLSLTPFLRLHEVSEKECHMGVGRKHVAVFLTPHGASTETE